MKAIIINGSPKGDYSVTLQYARYMLKNSIPDYEVLNIGKNIAKYENNVSELKKAADSIRNSDCVVWAFPVYTFLVPYQLLKFINLMIDNGLSNAFEGKYSCSVSTSKHFFDHTAHEYIRYVSQTVNMKFVDSYSADTDDLKSETNRCILKTFGSKFRLAVENKIPVREKYYIENRDIQSLDFMEINPGVKKETTVKKILILTDTSDENSNLIKMTETFRNHFKYETEVVNINDRRILGGCLGCLHCVFFYRCVYKDGYEDFYKNTILNTDILIYGITVKNGYFDPIWKKYFDRAFCNGHRLSRHGKSCAYILSGNVKNNPVVNEVIEGRAQVGGENLVGMVSDDEINADAVYGLLADLAGKVEYDVENHSVNPSMFPGVGGTKVFRDLIYSMRGIMKEDHRFYRKHKIYDFPQKDIKSHIFNLSMAIMLSSKKIKKEAFKTSARMMADRYIKIVESE